MPKTCMNCGCKLGFLTGEHFDGSLCDKCFVMFGGSEIHYLENDPDEYLNVYEEIKKKIDAKADLNADKDRIKNAFLSFMDNQFKYITGSGLGEFFARKEADQRRILRNKEKEVQHVRYAKSFREYYEYDVVTIINEDHGTVDKAKMMEILAEHSKNGWKLHTIYSNELGKNALKILGIGINSTACEDVMIFERRVENIDEE